VTHPSSPAAGIRPFRYVLSKILSSTSCISEDSDCELMITFEFQYWSHEGTTIKRWANVFDSFCKILKSDLSAMMTAMTWWRTWIMMDGNVELQLYPYD
jgi:hypothetical protein